MDMWWGHFRFAHCALSCSGTLHEDPLFWSGIPQYNVSGRGVASPFAMCSNTSMFLWHKASVSWILFLPQMLINSSASCSHHKMPCVLPEALPLLAIIERKRKSEIWHKSAELQNVKTKFQGHVTPNLWFFFKQSTGGMSYSKMVMVPRERIWRN